MKALGKVGRKEGWREGRMESEGGTVELVAYKVIQVRNEKEREEGSERRGRGGGRATWSW